VVVGVPGLYLLYLFLNVLIWEEGGSAASLLNRGCVRVIPSAHTLDVFSQIKKKI